MPLGGMGVTVARVVGGGASVVVSLRWRRCGGAPEVAPLWWWSWCPEVAQGVGGHGALRWHKVLVIMVP